MSKRSRSIVVLTCQEAQTLQERDLTDLKKIKNEDDTNILHLSTLVCQSMIIDNTLKKRVLELLGKNNLKGFQRWLPLIQHIDQNPEKRTAYGYKLMFEFELYLCYNF